MRDKHRAVDAPSQSDNPRIDSQTSTSIQIMTIRSPPSLRGIMGLGVLAFVAVQIRPKEQKTCACLKAQGYRVSSGTKLTSIVLRRGVHSPQTCVISTRQYQETHQIVLHFHPLPCNQTICPWSEESSYMCNHMQHARCQYTS
jgi:hypothetical protein